MKLKNMERKKILSILSLLSLVLLFVSSPVLADGIQDSIIATGTKKLLDDLKNWLPAIATGAGIVIVIYCFVRRALGDEMDKKKWTERIQTAIISTIGAVIGASIVSLLISYYS